MADESEPLTTHEVDVDSFLKKEIYSHSNTSTRPSRTRGLAAAHIFDAPKSLYAYQWIGFHYTWIHRSETGCSFQSLL